MSNTSKEIWKIYQITQKRKYEVSNIGRRKITNLISNTILHLDFGFDIFNGYPILKTNCGTVRMHQAIATLFLPNPDNKPQVNHIDGNKFNNHVDNLEWVTASENIQHAHKIGCFKNRIVSEETKKKIGKANSGKIPSEISKSKMSSANRIISDDLFLFKHFSGLIEFCSITELAYKYNLKKSSLKRVCNGLSITCNGWSI